MPSHLPSSFASAAAGSSRDTRNGRGDGRGSWDWYVASRKLSGSRRRWGTLAASFRAPCDLLLILFFCRSRREQRPANGTLTLRRNSQAPFTQSSQDAPPQTPGAETPGLSQHSNPYDSAPSGGRYTKQDILDIAAARKEVGQNKDVSALFMGGWDPDNSNGTNGRSGWGKTGDGRDNYGPQICWNRNGDSLPIAFEDMSDLEKTVSLTRSKIPSLC